MTETFPPLTLRETWAWLWIDLRQMSPHMAGGARGMLSLVSLLLTPAAACLILHRHAHWLVGRNLGVLARALAALNYFVNKAAICPGSRVGPGLFIPHPAGVVFHGHAGARLTLYHRAIVCPRTTHVDKTVVSADCPRLGDDVTVGVYSVVTGRVSIGSRTFVGAYAVAVEDAPADTVLLDRHSLRVAKADDQASAR